MKYKNKLMICNQQQMEETKCEWILPVEYHNWNLYFNLIENLNELLDEMHELDELMT